MTQNALVQRNDKNIHDLQIIARNAAQSGLYSKVGGESQILMIILAAAELGIKPVMALNGGLHNIQGKVEISARLMASMIRKGGHGYKIVQSDSKICVLEGKRFDNGDSFTSQFSMDDAIRAGIAGGVNWKKYPEDMLFARALSRLARRLFPDVIGPSYIEGEIADERPPISIQNVESNIEDAECSIINEIDEDRSKEFVLKHGKDKRDEFKEYLLETSSNNNKSVFQMINVMESKGDDVITERFELWLKNKKTHAA